MYTTQFEDFTKKPTILSHLTAEKEIAEWAAANDLRVLIDGDGHAWSLEVRGLPLPSKKGAGKGYWRGELLLKARLNGIQLVDGEWPCRQIVCSCQE